MEEQNYRRELPGSKRVILDIKELPFSAKEALNVLRGNIQSCREFFGAGEADALSGLGYPEFFHNVQI